MSNVRRHLHVFATLGILGVSLSGLCLRRAEAQKPVARFQWKMMERFGQRKSDGTVDFHWSTAFGTYDPSYVNPSSWKVELNACNARNAAGTFYTWTTLTQSVGPIQQCADTMPFLRSDYPYLVKLTVETPNGARDSVRDTVVVKDWLIVSLGDSYASGEGNPDVPQRLDEKAGWTVVTGPKWEDRRCHRSALSGPALAAAAIEQRDPHSSVTFLSFACSGAGIDSGLVGPYLGAEPFNPPLSAQVDQVASAVKGRPIDVLLISIGGNDIGLMDIAKKCWGVDLAATTASSDPLYISPPLPPISYCPHAQEVITPFWDKVHALPKRFMQLRSRLDNLSPRAVYFTEYPDPTHNKHSGDCGVDSPRLLYTLDSRTAVWARETVLKELNHAVQTAGWQYVGSIKHPMAVQPAGWHYVGNVAARFQNHGECAEEQRWFNTEEDARRIEGPYTPCGIDLTLSCTKGQPLVSHGTLHPNWPGGQQAYRDAILDAIQLPGSGSFTIPQAVVDLLPGAEAGTPSVIVVHTPYKTPVGRPLPAKVQIYGDSIWFDTDTSYTYTFHGSCQEVSVRAPTDLYFDTFGTVCVPLKQLQWTVPVIRADTLPLAPGGRAKRMDFVVGVYDKFNRPVAASVRIHEAGRPDTVVRANMQVTGFAFTVAVVPSASPFSQRFGNLIPRFRGRLPVNQKLGADEPVDPVDPTSMGMPELEGVTVEQSGQVIVAPSGEVIPDSPDYERPRFVFPLHNLVGGPLKPLPAKP